MTLEEVERFEKTNSLLKTMYEEVSLLSKKSPNDGLNKFKLKIVNDNLAHANSLLEGKHKPIESFTEFDVDGVVTNSDVAFVCSQYLTCLEKFRCDNIKYKDGSYVWIIDGHPSNIKTHGPGRLRS